MLRSRPIATLFPYTTLFRSEKAYLASMKSDLRNLVTAEEAYFADSIKYTITKTCTNPDRKSTRLNSSNKINTYAVITTNKETQAGWTATVTNANTAKSSEIF